MPAPNSPATDIAAILASAGIGTQGQDIFIGKEPALDGVIVTVFDAGGISPNAKFLRDEPQVHCRVRGDVNGYQAAWAKAQAIKDALLGLGTQTILDYNYVQFLQISEILPLGVDDSNRPIIVSNWQLVRELVSGNSNRVQL